MGADSARRTVDLHLRLTPDEADECETAGGLLLALFDRIPEVGDEIDCGPAHFTIVEMDNLRIEKVRVLIVPPATER